MLMPVSEVMSKLLCCYAWGGIGFRPDSCKVVFKIRVRCLCCCLYEHLCVGRLGLGVEVDIGVRKDACVRHGGP